MQPQNKLIGANGCKFIDSASGAVTGEKFYMIVVNEDAVLTVLSGDTENYLTTIGLSGKTIKQGAILTIAKEAFENITVASGSVMGYNE